VAETKHLDPAAHESLVVNGIDTADVPSAAWGWSAQFPRFTKVVGLLIAGFLLAMLVGNHRGKVEDLYLIGFASLIVLVIVIDLIRSRRPR